METENDDKFIRIDNEILNNLNATRKWTTFISVLGFIFLGLLIFIGAITGTFLTAFKSKETNLGIPESIMLLIFALTAVIYFFPVFFLFRFSRHTRNAVQKNDRDEFFKASKNLRAFFTYIGVMAIIVITVYIVALVVAGASISLLNDMG